MSPTPEQVFAGLHHEPGAVWLDGGRSGWSVLAWRPEEVCTKGDWVALGRELSRSEGRGAPFSGGCIGYLGFGAGHRVAPVPPGGETPEPEVWLGRYLGGLCYRHQDHSWHIGGTNSFVEEARERLANARHLVEPTPAGTAREGHSVDPHRYRADVERILQWIEAGDCYQVNLSRPVFVGAAGDPWQAYRRLRAGSPAGYGAYLRVDDQVVVASNSPELFLAVEGEIVRSRPIKGTRPRGATELDDQALAAELLASRKDLAELTMIVDLVRNDLGRVARVGSVTASPRQIESLANVHHAWQEVSAHLEPGCDAWDALAATFPPGSVTGAPKVRACQRIDQLEDHARGVYCGAIGFVDGSGRASWSVAIRTAVFDGDSARYHVGGGVVAASDPEEEWRETVAKGRQLAAALGVGSAE